MGDTMIRTAAALTLVLATTAWASADETDTAIADFINAPGFDAIDVVPLEMELADQWLDTDKVSPGGSVGPIEKALIIATDAIPSTRTRTAVSYGELIADDGAPLSFIEVRHYNLGPAVHAATVEAYGAEDTADVSEFGTGDHMAWRFVFRPMMNNAAILIDASQHTIAPKEAAKQDCDGRKCLDLYSGFDDRDWEEIEGTLPAWPDIYTTDSDEISTPAHAIAQLAVLGFWANAELGFYQWTGGEHPESVRDTTPYRFISIDRNLGQEVGIDAVWRETELMDDELSAIAFRRAEVAGQVFLMRSSEQRRP